MKLARLLVVGSLFIVAAPFALADPASPVLNISGSATFDTQVLNVLPPLASLGDTGEASVFSGGTVDYLLNSITYMPNVLSPLEVFTVSDARGDLLAFYTEDNAATAGVNSNGLWTINLDETGFYNVNGTQLPGYFNVTLTGMSATGSDGIVPFAGSGSLTSQPAAQLSDVTFSGAGGFRGRFAAFAAPLGLAPEPPAILLLGSALLGLGGMLFIKRRASRSATSS